MRIAASLALALAIGTGAATPAIAECIVLAPYDSAENIRLSPNGRVINRLRNGRVVHVEHTRYDYQGRPWAYVEGAYQGRWRRWGYIFTESLRCF